MLVELSKNSSPIDVALNELEIGILPLTIRHTLPDGTYQDIPISWLMKEE